MRCPTGIIPGESGQETGVPSELAGDPVVRVATDGEGEDDDPGREVPDLLHQHAPGLVGIAEVGIGKARVPALGASEDLRRPLGLPGTDLGAAAGGALAGGQVQDTGSVPRLGRPDERARTGELDVVAMGGDGQNVHGHGDSPAGVGSVHRRARSKNIPGMWAAAMVVGLPPWSRLHAAPDPSILLRTSGPARS